MTATGWKPADQVDRVRICAGPGCTREFRPRRGQDTYFSERCAARSAAAAVIDDSAPALRQTAPPEPHDGGIPAPPPAAAEPELGDAPAATPTLRALGPDTARAVICEVYAPTPASQDAGGGR